MSVIVIGLLRVCVSSQFTVGRLYLSNTCPFLLGCTFHRHTFYWLVVVSSDAVYFCGVGCNFCFLYNFIDLRLLIFFLKDQLNVYQFYLCFQRISFNFIDLYYLLVTISFISTLVFTGSFILLTLGFLWSTVQVLQV